MTKLVDPGHHAGQPLSPLQERLRFLQFFHVEEFWPVTKLTQVRLKANHMLLQSIFSTLFGSFMFIFGTPCRCSTRGSCKVFIFGLLNGDSTQAREKRAIFVPDLVDPGHHAGQPLSPLQERLRFLQFFHVEEFWPVTKLTQVRLKANHMLLQSIFSTLFGSFMFIFGTPCRCSTRGSCKVFIFGLLNGDSTQAREKRAIFVPDFLANLFYS